LLSTSSLRCCVQLAEACVLPWPWWQEVERAYLLWKARRVADQEGSGAVAVRGGEEGEKAEKREALLDFAVHGLKGDLFPSLMELMG
jgi:hypothetical protein